MGFAERNSAAALEWARQRNEQIKRAKQIKAERVGRQTQRPSKGPGAAGEEGGNRKNTKQSTPVPRAASAGCEEGAVPCDHSTIGGKDVDESACSALKSGDHLTHEDDRSRDNFAESGEWRVGEVVEQRVVRHGRRRTISPPFIEEVEKHEELENKPVHNLLATIRAKVQETKSSTKLQASAPVEVREDPTIKVRSKLQSLLPKHSNGDHLLQSDQQGKPASRPSSFGGPFQGKENCILRPLKDEQESEANALQEKFTGCSSLNQQSQIPSHSRKNVQTQQLFELRLAQLESLKRISSARRVKRAHQGNKEVVHCKTKDKGEYQGSQCSWSSHTRPDEVHRSSISLLSPQSASGSTLTNSALLHPKENEANQVEQTGKNTCRQKRSCIPAQNSKITTIYNATVPGSVDDDLQCSTLNQHIALHGPYSTDAEHAGTIPVHSPTKKAGAQRITNANWIQPMGEDAMAGINCTPVHTKSCPLPSGQHAVSNSAKPGTIVDLPPGRTVSNSEISMAEGGMEDTTQIPMLPCSICGRSFYESSLKKHKRVCLVVFKKKRKIFNSASTRVRGTDAERYYAPEKPRRRRTRVQYPGKRTEWREKSMSIREALKSMRFL